MTLEKIAKNTLDTTAYYQGMLDMNVNFYVNDTNTSILEFPITRNNKPVPLSEVNVNSYIAIKTPDGYLKVDYLQFYDKLNGILRYKLPDDVLAHVGKHTAQVYIAVNGVKDVVVERQIVFNVEDDLVNQVPSDTKLSYLRLFDDLYASIQQRVADIENAVKNASDYVTQITNARDKAYEDITALVNQTKNDINTLITQYKTDINKALTDSKADIDTQSKNYIQQAENAKTEVTQAIANAEFMKEAQVRELIAPLQTKEEASNSNNALLQQANNYSDSLFSQTNQNTTLVNNVDFNNFSTFIQKSGVYYFIGGKNSPNGVYKGLIRYIKYATSPNPDTPETTTGYIEVIPDNNSDFIYATWINQNVISGWKRTFRVNITDGMYTKTEVNNLVSNAKNEVTQSINNSYTDTGWIDIALINGAVPYASNTVPKVKLLTVNNSKIISLKGAVKGITQKGTIGMIPKSIADNIGDSRSFVQNTSAEGSITNFNRFSFSANGEIRLDGSTLNPIKDTHWILIETTFLL